MWDSDSKEAGYSHEWGLNACSENVEKSRWTDICFEKKNRNILREGFMTQKSGDIPGMDSSSEKGGKFCKWDSGFEEGKISSERNSGSKKGKKLYRKWNLGFEATDKSCVRDSSSKETRKHREWGKDFEEVEVSYQWDSRSIKGGKPSERYSLAQKVEKIRLLGPTLPRSGRIM